MLSGKSPQQHPSPLSPEIPSAIRDIVGQLLQKNPDDRPSDARYVRQQLEEALLQSPDSTSVTLFPPPGNYVHPATSTPAQQPGDVFVSYASHDRKRVFDIVNHLESAGVRVWLDHHQTDERERSSLEVKNGIEKCKLVLVMCSNASLRSRSVKAEMQMVWKYKRLYLPLLLEPTSFPEQLAYWCEDKQWIDIGKKPIEQWLPVVLQSLEHSGVKCKTAVSGGGLSGPIVQPTSPDQKLRGLQVVGSFTDQIWPRPAATARRFSRAALRDLGEAQDDMEHGYHIGDQVALTIESDRPGHLLLIDEGTSGKVYCLCPSWFAPDVRIPAGAVSLPQAGSRHSSFKITGSPGREHLLAIITNAPLGLDWLPSDPKKPARVLTSDDIDDLLTRLHKLEADQWTALATYFDVVA
jgi:hypothetical protein